MMNLEDLERNDVTGALVAYGQALRSGEVSYEFTHTLVRLQDDPAALQLAITQLTGTPPPKARLYPADERDVIDLAQERHDTGLADAVIE